MGKLRVLRKSRGKGDHQGRPNLLESGKEQHEGTSLEQEEP
jgi:hypothetical protein